MKIGLHEVFRLLPEAGGPPMRVKHMLGGGDTRQPRGGIGRFPKRDVHKTGQFPALLTTVRDSGGMEIGDIVAAAKELGIKSSPAMGAVDARVRDVLKRFGEEGSDGKWRVTREIKPPFFSSPRPPKPKQPWDEAVKRVPRLVSHPPFGAGGMPSPSSARRPDPGDLRAELVAAVRESGATEDVVKRFEGIVDDLLAGAGSSAWLGTGRSSGG